MFDYDDDREYMDFSEEGFREVQQCLDRFVTVNYETALGLLYRMKATPEDIALYKGKVLDIIRHNPPLESIPRYFWDGREDYLWYSDFYDDITKEVYQRYRTFTAPAVEITPVNYTEELAKIDLPYFKELVDLVSLEKLCMLYEANQLSNKTEADTEEEADINTDAEAGKEDIVDKSQESESGEQTQTTQSDRQPKKRSYEPKLNTKQYALLAECVEDIKLFRRKVKTSELKKLLKGKLTEALEITNQKSLVYLLDLLSGEEVMEYLHISPRTLQNLRDNRIICYTTIGGKILYPENELEQVLHQNYRSPELPF